jgi:predicted MPP superfamily phosphohydrolase
MRSRFVVFVAVFQTVLILGHIFLYQTWKYFWHAPDSAGVSPLALALAFLSISFVAATLLAFRFNNLPLRWFYTISAVWIGTLSFLFFAACFTWIIYGAVRLGGVHPDQRMLAAVMLGIAVLLSAVALINAEWTRTKKIKVRLPNLPASWRGRKAALITDLHLGHVHNAGFARRMVTKINALKPDIVWIAGDLYDGTAIDAARAIEPLRLLKPPLGTFFVEGNHEEFSNPAKYLNAIRGVGVRVLNNEKVDVDGLQILGVTYRDATHAGHFGSVLDRIGINRARASVLLSHAPDQVAVAAGAGIGLQVSGHTHVGQFLPYTWLAARIYKQFVYGLQRSGSMQVYTSSGAGTWGPPLRLGSNPEIVLIEFE